MKTYTTVTRHYDDKVLSETRCDLCGATTKSEWRKGCYDATEVEVRLKTGESYPDNGSGEETTIDICPDCFRDKLIPWVESQGGKPETKEWCW